MSTPARFTLLVAIAIAVPFLFLPPAAHAQGAPPQIPGKLVPLLTTEWLPPLNETGFTLGDLLSQNLWVLARHPLAMNPLKQIDVDMHRAPRPGVQLELFTPGDVGATIHVRW